MISRSDGSDRKRLPVPCGFTAAAFAAAGFMVVSHLCVSTPCRGETPANPPLRSPAAMAAGLDEHGLLLFVADSATGWIYYSQPSAGGGSDDRPVILTPFVQLKSPSSLAYGDGTLYAYDAGERQLLSVRIGAAAPAWHVLDRGRRLGGIAVAAGGLVAASDVERGALVFLRDDAEVHPHELHSSDLERPRELSFAGDRLHLSDDGLHKTLRVAERLGHELEIGPAATDFADPSARITSLTSAEGVSYAATDRQVLMYLAKDDRSLSIPWQSSRSAARVTLLAAAGDWLFVLDDQNDIHQLKRPAPADIRLNVPYVLANQALCLLYRYLLDRDLLPVRPVILAHAYPDLRQLLVEEQVLVGPSTAEPGARPGGNAPSGARAAEDATLAWFWRLNPKPGNVLAAGATVLLPDLPIRSRIRYQVVQLSGKPLSEVLREKVFSPRWQARVSSLSYLSRQNPKLKDVADLSLVTSGQFNVPVEFWELTAALPVTDLNREEQGLVELRRLAPGRILVLSKQPLHLNAASVAEPIPAAGPGSAAPAAATPDAAAPAATAPDAAGQIVGGPGMPAPTSPTQAAAGQTVGGPVTPVPVAPVPVSPVPAAPGPAPAGPAAATPCDSLREASTTLAKRIDYLPSSQVPLNMALTIGIVEKEETVDKDHLAFSADANNPVWVSLSDDSTLEEEPVNQWQGEATDVTVNPTPSPEYVEDHHGSHVAAIVAGRSACFSGLLPRSQLYLIDSTEPSSIVRGIDDAINSHIQTINLSADLGDRPKDIEDLQTIISKRPGTMFVIAAGNQNRDFNDEKQAGTPPVLWAHYPNVLVVTGLDADNILAPSAEKPVGRGRRAVHLAAPGAGIYSATEGKEFAPFSGTSQATPQVTAAAAILMNRDCRNPGRVKARLIATAEWRPLLQNFVWGGLLDFDRAVGFSSETILRTHTHGDKIFRLDDLRGPTLVVNRGTSLYSRDPKRNEDAPDEIPLSDILSIHQLDDKYRIVFVDRKSSVVHIILDAAITGGKVQTRGQGLWNEETQRFEPTTLLGPELDFSQIEELYRSCNSYPSKFSDIPGFD